MQIKSLKLQAQSKTWINLIIATLPLFYIVTLPLPPLFNLLQWKFIGSVWLVIYLWSSSTFPLGVSSLFPLILFPLTGVMSEKVVTSNYSHPIIFLFMGGFFIAQAIQYWGLHKRIALNILSVFAKSPQKLIAGFMIATAFLSMWISNTATTILMFTIGLSVTKLLSEYGKTQPEICNKINKSLMLSIAYAASIGGASTLIGTPPNTFLAGFLAQHYNIQLDVLTWMKIGVPYLIIMLPLAWLWLSKSFFNQKNFDMKTIQNAIQIELSELGPLKKQELLVLIIFTLTAGLWITKKLIINYFHIPLSDSIIAIFGALLLMCIPLNKENNFLLNWEIAKKIPWDILFLFGAGLSIANGFLDVKLLELLADQFASLSHLNYFFIIISLCILTLILTELSSNLATIAILLPFIASLALALEQPVLMFCIPVTLAASGAFMLPVATPPNAIVFAYKELKIGDMIRTGFILNIFAIIVIFLLAVFFL